MDSLSQGKPGFQQHQKQPTLAIFCGKNFNSDLMVASGRAVVYLLIPIRSASDWSPLCLRH